MKFPFASRPVTLALLMLTGPLFAAPPANDLFVNRLNVTGLSLISGTTIDATQEFGEPSHGFIPGGRSVWYSWTAPASGEVTLRVTNNSFGPLLGVYTGASVNSLTAVASSSFVPTLAVQVVAATTYHIAIDGTVGGGFTLSFSDVVPPPANNAFASRAILSGITAHALGSNVAASKEAGEPAHAGNPGGKSVWYSWTAPATGVFTSYFVSLTDAGAYNLVPLMGIYTGTSVGGLTPVASTSGMFVSSLNLPFSAVAGTTYQIAIDGSSAFAGANSGPFLLNITQPPVNNLFANRINLGSASTTSSSSWVDLGTNTEFQEPSAGAPLLRTIWWSWTAPSSGFFSIDTLGSDFDNVLQVFTGPGLGAITFVMENQAADDQGRARLALNATAGTTYHFRVGGQTGNDIGNVTLQ